MAHFGTSLYCTSIILPVGTLALIEINSHFGGGGRVAYQKSDEIAVLLHLPKLLFLTV